MQQTSNRIKVLNRLEPEAINHTVGLVGIRKRTIRLIARDGDDTPRPRKKALDGLVDKATELCFSN